MSTSASRYAYEDCYDLLDRALESNTGVRFVIEDDDVAEQWRVRLHRARQLSRDESRERYEPGHPEYGKSVYDKLVVSIKSAKGARWIYIAARKAPLVIEDLDNVVSSNGPTDQGNTKPFHRRR
jgi:hypothetical protein